MAASSVRMAVRICAGATAAARSSLATAAGRSPAASSSRADTAHCSAILPATCRETPGDCCGAVRGFDEGRRVLDGGAGGQTRPAKPLWACSQQPKSSEPESKYFQGCTHFRRFPRQGDWAILLPNTALTG